jgi:hypothetical protein
MDARTYDHRPDYSQSRRWTWRSRGAGLKIVAHAFWKPLDRNCWIRRALLSPPGALIRSPRRLRYARRSLPRGGRLDRIYQGYPKQSPLTGAPAPNFESSVIDTLRRSLAWGDFPPVASRLAFPHRIGKLPSSCRITLTWKHAAVRRCTGFNSRVERGARQIC